MTFLSKLSQADLQAIHALAGSVVQATDKRIGTDDVVFRQKLTELRELAGQKGRLEIDDASLARWREIKIAFEVDLYHQLSPQSLRKAGYLGGMDYLLTSEYSRFSRVEAQMARALWEEVNPQKANLQLETTDILLNGLTAAFKNNAAALLNGSAAMTAVLVGVTLIAAPLVPALMTGMALVGAATGATHLYGSLKKSEAAKAGGQNLKAAEASLEAVEGGLLMGGSLISAGGALGLKRWMNSPSRAGVDLSRQARQTLVQSVPLNFRYALENRRQGSIGALIKLFPEFERRGEMKKAYDHYRSAAQQFSQQIVALEEQVSLEHLASSQGSLRSLKKSVQTLQKVLQDEGHSLTWLELRVLGRSLLNKARVAMGRAVPEPQMNCSVHTMKTIRNWKFKIRRLESNKEILQRAENDYEGLGKLASLFSKHYLKNNDPQSAAKTYTHLAEELEAIYFKSPNQYEVWSQGAEFHVASGDLANAARAYHFAADNAILSRRHREAMTAFGQAAYYYKKAASLVAGQGNGRGASHLQKQYLELYGFLADPARVRAHHDSSALVNLAGDIAHSLNLWDA